jgi:uncharacterized protein (DUF433 family)
MDWSKCADVERDPERISGQWAIKGTRIPVQALLDNADDFTPEEIVAQIYPSLPLNLARRVIAFARHEAHADPA